MKRCHLAYFILTLSILLLSSKCSYSQSQQAHLKTEAQNLLSSDDVQFQNEDDDVIISGTLTIPLSSSQSSHPAVVLIPGDGPQTRNESIIVALSNFLSDCGFIVLRTDKRGSGRSSGDLSMATTADLAKDAMAAVNFLQKDERISPEKVGLIGHSEGSLIAAMVASKMPEIAFIVLMAYPSVGVEETLHLQRDLRLRDQGASPDLIAFERHLWTRMFTSIRQGISSNEIFESATRLVSKRSGKLSQEYSTLKLGTPDVIFKESFSEFKTPWFLYLLDYDPTETLSQVQCPLLAVFASKDWQVPPVENMQVLKQALSKGNHTEYSVEVLPGLNHRFQRAKSGSPKEYGTLKEPIATLALQHIGAWLKKQK